MKSRLPFYLFFLLPFSPLAQQQQPVSTAPGELSWEKVPDEKTCMGNLCIHTAEDSFSRMFAKPSREDRIRIKDPHSIDSYDKSSGSKTIIFSLNDNNQ